MSLCTLFIGQIQGPDRGHDLIAGADHPAVDHEVRATTRGTTEAAADHVTGTTKEIIPAKTETRAVVDQSRPNTNTMTMIDIWTRIEAAQHREAQVVATAALRQTKNNHLNTNLVILCEMRFWVDMTC